MRGRKKNNPTGGKGKGRGGRKNFIDEIISKVETSQRLSSQRPQAEHSLQIDYEIEEVVGPKRVEEIVEHIEEPVEDIEEPIKDIKVEELVQDIECPIESSEDWESAIGEEPLDGNNEGIFGGGHAGGEERGANSLSTLEFPIGEIPRGATPMKNTPLSA